VQPRALGRKASDEFAVPLCRIHHRAAHRAGNERAWWKAAGIDPLKVARKLWTDTRGNKGQEIPNLSSQFARTDRPLTSDGVDSKAMAFTLALRCSATSLFHDPNGAAFADLAIDGHRETWPIRSRQFRHWLRRRYGAASMDTIRSALDLFEARAQFDAPERTVHTRVAEHNGDTYLDLADKIGGPSR
jgi:hypothetical protein